MYFAYCHPYSLCRFRTDVVLSQYKEQVPQPPDDISYFIGKIRNRLKNSEFLADADVE